LREAVDQRRADHRGVGGAGDFGGLLRGLDAEADRDRQLVNWRSRATASRTAAESAERVPVMPAIAT
jgi:hypothetical protein